MQRQCTKHQSYDRTVTCKERETSDGCVPIELSKDKGNWYGLIPILHCVFAALLAVSFDIFSPFATHGWPCSMITGPRISMGMAMHPESSHSAMPRTAKESLWLERGKNAAWCLHALAWASPLHNAPVVMIPTHSATHESLGIASCNSVYLRFVDSSM